MRNFLAVFFISVLFIACNSHNNGPDVSNIKVDMAIERFDKSFFSLDTNNIAAAVQQLNKVYPVFYTDFMQQILGVSGSDTNKVTLDAVKSFFRSYLPLYNDLKKKYSDDSWLKKDIRKAFQYVKYYFPDYNTSRIILFVGPLDAPGTAITRSGIAIGLHQFAGRDFPAYQSMEAQQLFPAYISRRFEPQYIVANCMRAVVEDLYPDKTAGKGLIEQMIEKGKQWWLLDKFLPLTPDSIKTGFTRDQLSWCKENEGLVWNDIITTQKDLYTKDPMSIQNYIGEAPYTQSLGPSSPGNIGQWIGWQIIKKFAEKNSSMKVEDVLKTDAGKIMEEAKYKPK
jgi:hypothetical protein